MLNGCQLFTANFPVVKASQPTWDKYASRIWRYDIKYEVDKPQLIYASNDGWPLFQLIWH